TSLSIAAGNTAEALVGGYLVSRFAGGRRALHSTHSVLRFSLLGAAVAPIVSATVGVATIRMAGLAGPIDLGSIWLTWWLGDATGALLVAPFLIAALTQPPPRPDRRTLVLGSMLVLLAAVALAVFTELSPYSLRNYPLEFFVVPVVLWVALEFGPRETSAAVLLLSVVAIAGTIGGTGPFGRQAPNDALLLLQTFMGITSMTALLLAAAVTERRAAEAAARASEERLALIAERQEAEE